MKLTLNTAMPKKLIDKFSTDHVSVRERSLTKDRVALTTTVGANTDTALNAVVTNFDKGEIDGTEILANDLKIIADSQKSISKSDGDQILIGSTTYRIMAIREINPAGTVLAYEIQARL